MYADRSTLGALTPARPSARYGPTALFTRLGELADLLGAAPAADRAELRSQIQELQREMREVGWDHGLLALLLRNMLADLAKTPGRFDGEYFSKQLSLVANSLQ